MHQDIEKVLITQAEIRTKVEELGQVLSHHYAGKNPLVVCILKGASIFLADLIRAMKVDLQMDFMAVSSYGTSSKSSGVVRIIKDLEQNIQGRHVLIIEDIVDTGLTLSYLLENLKTRGPADVRICTLLDKPSRRKVKIKVDYNGFSIPDEFVVGYGLDYQERYRNLPDVCVLKKEIYQG